MIYYNELDKLIKTKAASKGLSTREVQELLFSTPTNYGKRMKKPENLRIQEIKNISKLLGIDSKLLVDLVVRNEYQHNDEFEKVVTASMEKCQECEKKNLQIQSLKEQCKMLRELSDSKDISIQSLQRELGHKNNLANSG